MKKGSMKENVAQEVYLHTIKGLSTYKIAELLYGNQRAIRNNLYRHGVLKQALGRDIEERVAKYLEKKGSIVIRQKGDCSYDLLVNNKRVDVKSAHKTFAGGKNDWAYFFDIKHKDALYTDYHKDKDELYLVFLDEPDCPIYSLDVNDIQVKCTLRITHINNTKYPIKLIGYLGE